MQCVLKAKAAGLETRGGKAQEAPAPLLLSCHQDLGAGKPRLSSKAPWLQYCHALTFGTPQSSPGRTRMAAERAQCATGSVAP